MLTLTHPGLSPPEHVRAALVPVPAAARGRGAFLPRCTRRSRRWQRVCVDLAAAAVEYTNEFERILRALRMKDSDVEVVVRGFVVRS